MTLNSVIQFFFAFFIGLVGLVILTMMFFIAYEWISKIKSGRWDKMPKYEKKKYGKDGLKGLGSGAVVIAILVWLVIPNSSCGQRPSTVSPNIAQETVDKLIYIKSATTGECFALVGHQRVGEIDQEGITLTWVPCSDGVLKHLK